MDIFFGLLAVTANLTLPAFFYYTLAVFNVRFINTLKKRF